MQQKQLKRLMNGRVYAGNISGRREARPAAPFASCTGIHFSLGEKKQHVPAEGTAVPASPWEPTRSDLMPRVSARESQRNCWMHYDMFGLGSAEHMAGIGKMPDCLVAAGSSFKFHSFFLEAKKSVS